jgi:hypothetical protein
MISKPNKYKTVEQDHKWLVLERDLPGKVTNERIMKVLMFCKKASEQPKACGHHEECDCDCVKKQSWTMMYNHKYIRVTVELIFN